MDDLHARLQARVDELRQVQEKATPGPWKMWGMSVLTDRGGTGEVNYAETIAHTSDPDRGMRTFNGSFMCTFDPVFVATALDHWQGVLDRHKPENHEYGLVCEQCVTFQGRFVDDGAWPCDEIRPLATALGVTE